MIQKKVIKCLSGLFVLLTLGVTSIYGAEQQSGFNLYAGPRLIPRPTDYISQEEVNKDLQTVRKQINNVLKMYGFEDQTFTVNTNLVVNDVNASYNHSTRTFTFPYVLRNGMLYATCLDEGIVSHEGGHMVLYLLGLRGNSPHVDALHESFGDLSAHFFRFRNQKTRHEFLENLTYDTGCVGDTNFSCIRNSSQPLRLHDVARDQSLCEPHELSKPFTTAIYGNMTDYYQNRGLLSRWFTWGESEAGSIVSWHKFVLVKAIRSLKMGVPTLMDVAKEMLVVSFDNALYREGLGRCFIANGLIVLMYKQPTRKYVYEKNQKYGTLCIRPNTTRRIAV